MQVFSDALARYCKRFSSFWHWNLNFQWKWNCGITFYILFYFHILFVFFLLLVLFFIFELFVLFLILNFIPLLIAASYSYQIFGLAWFGVIWFLCLMAYQPFVGYLIPNPYHKNYPS